MRLAWWYVASREDFQKGLTQLCDLAMEPIAFILNIKEIVENCILSVPLSFHPPSTWTTLRLSASHRFCPPNPCSQPLRLAFSPVLTPNSPWNRLCMRRVGILSSRHLWCSEERCQRNEGCVWWVLSSTRGGKKSVLLSRLWGRCGIIKFNC